MRKSSKYLVACGLATVAIFVLGQILTKSVRAQVSTPVLTKLLPKIISAGAPTFTVRVQGTGFQDGALIILDGNALPSSRLVSKKIILAEVDASVVANAGSHTLQVRNPDGGVTDSASLPVVAPDPDLFMRLGGNAAQEGQPQDLAIEITGQGFTAASTVSVWGSAAATTTFTNDTDLTTTLPQEFLTDHARIPILVRNPKGTVSNTEIFFVVEAPPKISSIDPDTIQVGSDAVTVTVTGGRLATTAVIVVNDQPLQDSKLVKVGRLTGTLPASLLTAPGELVVRIEQDGIQSVNQTITVAPAKGPFIFRIAPSRFRIGLKKDTVTLFGANFLEGTKALVDGQEVKPTGTKRTVQLVIGKDLLSVPGSHTVQMQDADGNLSNVATFQVVPDVSVSTFAGRDNIGFSANCVSADTATFRGPRRISIGPDGLLYLTDQLNHAIRSIDPSTGEICTVASDPKGLPGYNDTGNPRGFPVAFADPNGLAVAHDGTIYVSENGNAVLRRIVRAADGSLIVDTFAGGWAPVTDRTRQDHLNSTKLGIDGLKDGPAAQALFRQPDDIVIAPDGTMYVSDAANAVIRRIRQTSSGPVVDTIAGNGVPGFADGMGTSAFFDNPTGLALSPDAKFLYVADFFNFRIRRIDLSSFRVDTLAGSGNQGDDDGPPGDATFDQVFGLAVDSDGTIYVSEFGSGVIRRVDPDGNVNTLAGGHIAKLKDGPGVSAGFSSPKGLAIDRANGVLYVADFGHWIIRKIQLR